MQAFINQHQKEWQGELWFKCPHCSAYWAQNETTIQNHLRQLHNIIFDSSPSATVNLQSRARLGVGNPARRPDPGMVILQTLYTERGMQFVPRSAKVGHGTPQDPSSGVWVRGSGFGGLGSTRVQGPSMEGTTMASSSSSVPVRSPRSRSPRVSSGSALRSRLLPRDRG
jgi:hypothetical protein